jgi:hypothetical protein
MIMNDEKGYCIIRKLNEEKIKFVPKLKPKTIRKLILIVTARLILFKYAVLK